MDFNIFCGVAPGENPQNCELKDMKQLCQTQV